MMTHVLLPQAVTAMLPAVVSQLVVIVKDTALGGIMLGFAELLNSRSTLAANYANVIPSFIVVGDHLHRPELPPHQLRELAGAEAAAQQEVHGRGSRPRTRWRSTAARGAGAYGTVREQRRRFDSPPLR